MDNLPPGVTGADIDAEFIEEHKCEAGPKYYGVSRCIFCNSEMEDDGI